MIMSTDTEKRLPQFETHSRYAFSETSNRRRASTCVNTQTGPLPQQPGNRQDPSSLALSTQLYKS